MAVRGSKGLESSMKRFLIAAVFGLGMVVGGSAFAEDVVTIYAADGLHDGKPNWAQTQFDEFTKKTGIKVQYIEAGSGGVVERVSKKSTNPQADVLVTLPPFIMKAGADGLLQPYKPAGADQIDAAQKDKDGLYVALCNNYMNFIYNTSLWRGAQDLRRSARPEIQGQAAVFDSGSGGRRHRGHDPGVPRLRQQGQGLRFPEKAAGEQPWSLVFDRQADRTCQQGRAVCRQRRHADEHRPDAHEPEHPGVLAGRARRQALDLRAALLHRPCEGRAARRRRQEADRLPALQGSARQPYQARQRSAGAQGRDPER